MLSVFLLLSHQRECWQSNVEKEQPLFTTCMEVKLNATKDLSSLVLKRSNMPWQQPSFCCSSTTLPSSHLQLIIDTGLSHPWMYGCSKLNPLSFILKLCKPSSRCTKPTRLWKELKKRHLLKASRDRIQTSSGYSKFDTGIVLFHLKNA